MIKEEIAVLCVDAYLQGMKDISKILKETIIAMESTYDQQYEKMAKDFIERFKDKK